MESREDRFAHNFTVDKFATQFASRVCITFVYKYVVNNNDDIIKRNSMMNGIHDNIRGGLADELPPPSCRPTSPRFNDVAGYGRTRTAHIPGIVLFLEIRAGLNLRRSRFRHIGCRLSAAVLGLLAHPGRHLIRQAREHLATYVNEIEISPLCLSFSLPPSDRTTTLLAHVLAGIKRNCHRNPRERPE